MMLPKTVLMFFTKNRFLNYRSRGVNPFARLSVLLNTRLNSGMRLWLLRLAFSGCF